MAAILTPPKARTAGASVRPRLRPGQAAGAVVTVAFLMGVAALIIAGLLPAAFAGLMLLFLPLAPLVIGGIVILLTEEVGLPGERRGTSP